MKLTSPISRAWLKPYVNKALSLIAIQAMALTGIASADSSDLVVTEIQSDSVNTSTGGDYWELTNNGTTSVDLSNWKWNDSARINTGNAVTIPSGTTIAAGESILFTGVTETNFRTWWGLSNSVQVISNASVPGLGSSDGISLFTNTGTEVLYLSYGANGYTRSDGSASVAGHAGVSAGGAAKSALVLDPTFATITSKRRYTAATTGKFGAKASTSPSGDVGSPGVSGLPKAIDLSMYVRVGRYDLPEPTRTTPPNATNLLAQEASGVTYNWDTDTLFITCDGGTSIVQVSKTGQLVDSMTLAPGNSPQSTDFYDPEGITYIGNGQFVISEERDRQLVLFTYAANTTLSRSGAKTVKLGTFVPNTGTEGLSYDPQTGGFICLKEIDPMGIFQTGVDFDAGTATNGSATTQNSVNLFDPALTGMLDFADVFALSNVPSLSGQPDSSRLLLLSQESANIVSIDRSGTIYSTLTIQSDAGNPLTAAAQQHEGVTMDRNGNLYVVSENGGGDFDHPQLWVYAPSAVPNQAPTLVSLSNSITSIAENSSTATRVKVADISVSDDGLGTNSLTVTGADASFFEIVAGALYIKAGTVLDYETKTSYSITVNVDDSTVGNTPDATISYALAVTDIVNEAPVLPSLIISEVAPWSSGNSPVGADWFEVTNTGTTAVDITGWKVDDSSPTFATAVALNGITSIAPGESVIFIETADLTTTGSAFRSNWFGVNPPAGLQIGSYSGSGIGLGSSGDAVNLYNSSGTVQASVSFGASPTGPYPTFNNAVGLNNTAISTRSVIGVNGALAAVNSPTEIGSPGSVGKLFISEVAPWSSGNSPVGADWFEVTNTTAHAVDITGWKVDDSSESFAAALELNGVTSIAPGESVIFMETADLATTAATFRSTWFGANPPGALQIGSYTGGGIGLSTGGDAVNLYNAAGVLKAKVFFAASPTGPYATFDNASGSNGVAISQLSVVGVNGAATAVNDVAEIGSPGAIFNVAPSITTSPAGLTISNGGTATLTVDATGTPLPTFQWYRGVSGDTSNPISGATARTLLTAQLATTTSYWARATNAGGTADSSAATVTVINSPVYSNADINILAPNTDLWSSAGVTVNGSQFINLGLQGVGRVAASSKDPATGESIGSVSDMQITGWKKNADGSYSGAFHFLPDRGYNSGVIYSNYAARINAFDFTFTPYTSATPTAAQNQISLAFAGSTRFTYDHDGDSNTPSIFTTGLNADSTATLFGTTVPTASGNSTQSDGTFANRLTVDSEGLVFDSRVGKNGSGWVGDEYGAYIYHFNSAKQIDGQLQLPAALVPHKPAGTVNFNGTPTTGRRDNQGMEGIAQSPDGKKLFGLMQSAMIQDSGSGNQGRFNTRLLVYDLTGSDIPSDPVAQYVIQLPRIDTTGSMTNGSTVDRTGAQSSILALNDHQLLILSRDGNGRGATGSPVFKSILLADLTGATNIDGNFDAEGAAVAPAGVLNVSVTPISWSQALNLIGGLGATSTEVAKFGLNLKAAPGDSNSIGEKWEALSLVSANDSENPNDYFLFVGNDNDFMTGSGKYMDATGALQDYDAGLENDTWVFAYRVRMTGPDNQAPFVANMIPDQTIEDDAISFTFSADTFSDPDGGQTLSYTATKADDTALPDWLSFDPLTRTFSGSPSYDDEFGTLVVKVTAKDNGTPSLWTSTTFSIEVPTVLPETSLIHLADAIVSANQGATVATITVTRSVGISPVTVEISTADGSALAGTDYVTPTGAAATVNFPANVSTVSKQITLIPDLTATQNKSFTVTLTNPSEYASIGNTAPTTTTVRILAGDNIAPTVTLTQPTANQVINKNESDIISVTGTAKDNLEVNKVQVSLNGDEYVDATLSNGISVTNWALDVTPVGGKNDLKVRALDARGNASVIATRSFTYKKLSALTVNAGVGGKVTGKLNGTVYEVGKSYTLTAIPDANQAFEGWAGAGLTAPSNEVAKLTFVFSEALFLNPVITASFVAKPFLADEIGVFTGLVTPHAGTVLSNSAQGFMTLTMTATGSFSGSLKIDSFTLSIKGLFTNEGDARFGTNRASSILVERPGKASLELSEVHWDASANTISGVIKQYLRSQVIAQSDFTLDRSVFSAKIPVSPTTYTTAGGKYTVILQKKVQTNGLIAMDFPQGDGIGLITITPAGNVNLVGTLADDTPVTASAPLSSALEAPLFVQLYKLKGSFSALVKLDDTQSNSDLGAIDAVWFRPFQTNVQHYPWGWEEGVKLDLLGAKYVSVANTRVIPTIVGVPEGGNATLTFSDGLLMEVLSNDVNISDKNAVTQIPIATSTTYTLSIAAATGDIKGTFLHTDGSKPAFKGKVYQKGVYSGAHGFFLSSKPKVIDGLGESGGVHLIKK